MNARIIRFLFGTATALAITLLLLAEQVPMPAASAPPPPALRLEVAVTTTTDEYNDGSLSGGPPNGMCSLREAIKTMNGSTDFGGCVLDIVSGSLPSRVFLPSGTYTLTLYGPSEDSDATGDLDISSSMLIIPTGAPTATVIADTGWYDRIFDVVSGVVTMKGLTIRGGFPTSGGGGGVRVAPGASLSLNDSELTGNHSINGGGGGIANSGTLILTNVILSANQVTGFGVGIGGGGGIYNGGTATLTNVTLSGNSSSEHGGGIYNYIGAAATLTNVTLSSNSAASTGGGIANSGTLALTNVTLSGNSAYNPGGGINSNGTATLTNVTLSGNQVTGPYVLGWGIAGSPTLINTIVTNSLGGNCSTTLGGSSNLSSDNTCGFGGGDNVSVMLAPLGNYGGTTLTHMLMPGSPAIDSGTNTGCPSTDQRGYSRPVNGTCDVGAVERQPVDFSYWLNLPLILK